MSLQNISGILCSIGMFLFGIDIMSDALNRCYGEKMKTVLSICTKNKITGVLTGMAVTSLIQSSCATTVMTVSFINCNAITLSQAVGVIMGANIGTTATSLLLAIKFSAIAPLAVFIGTAIKMFSKKTMLQNVGLVIVGFGLLFVSMSNMEEYMLFFKESGTAEKLLLTDGRIKSLLAGFIITAVMQSSSATVGILQTAAAGGIVSTKNAVYILFGQNIGAVIPTLLSSVKASHEAKKAALVHLLFNVFATALFIIISEITPYIIWLDKIEDGYFKISAAHIIFNVASTIVFLPFSNFLAKSAGYIEEKIFQKQH